jgi:penicillin-binding protein 1C
VEPFIGLLRSFGFANLRDADFYGPSLALGSADVRLWDLVNAYRTLANRGLWGEMALLAAKPPAGHRRVLSEQASFIISDVLSDRESRSLTFGLENPLANRFWTAAKTGTSKDMRDNWCIGYSDSFTVGVWVGNDSGEPMWNISGISGAAPSWAEIMGYLHRDRTSRAPKPPRGLVRALAPAEDWFIRGTEPSSLALTERPRGAVPGKIAYPVQGMLLAIDPDIPSDQQRVFVEAENKDSNLRFELNGADLGDAGHPVLWKPVPGRYRLSLKDGQGLELDSVTFEVRGQVTRPRGG